MQDHLHMIMSLEAKKIPSLMRDFQRFTSRRISSILKKEYKKEALKVFHRAVTKHRDKNNYKVWQDGYHPKAIISDDMLIQKMEYIHQNPVVKGYVELEEDWKYSSARNVYLKDDSVIELDDIGM